MNAGQVIDLDRFPIDRHGAARDDLIARCRADLAADGMFNLQGFLRPDAVDETLTKVRKRLATDAFTHARMHNIYFKRDLPDLPPDHPALAQTKTVNHTLTADQVAGTPVDFTYHFKPFAVFLAEVMNMPALHTMDDPLAALNVMGYEEGEALNWHFDRSQFTTTLLLQAPDGGGAFQYRTNLRTNDDPNYDGVAALLRGEDDEIRTLNLTPGTLNVFLGKNTAHRVTPVVGPNRRIIAVLSYYDRPGVRFSAEEQVGFYGRSA